MLRKGLLALNRDEIQEIAERVERVVFLTYQPLTVEGSLVRARIALRDAVTHRRNARVEYKYTFLFTCVRQNGRYGRSRNPSGILKVEAFIPFAAQFNLGPVAGFAYLSSATGGGEPGNALSIIPCAFHQ